MCTCADKERDHDVPCCDNSSVLCALFGDSTVRTVLACKTQNGEYYSVCFLVNTYRFPLHKSGRVRSFEDAVRVVDATKLRFGSPTGVPRSLKDSPEPLTNYEDVSCVVIHSLVGRIAFHSTDRFSLFYTRQWL